MFGLSDRSLFFLGGTFTFNVFFFSDSGSFGKGLRSKGTIGTASFLKVWNTDNKNGEMPLECVTEGMTQGHD